MELIQVLVAGIAQGCVYGLIALGFVLIYKATEQVNFAQGDIMMLGMFAAFTLIAIAGFPWWLGALIGIAITAFSVSSSTPPCCAGSSASPSLPSSS